MKNKQAVETCPKKKQQNQNKATGKEKEIKMPDEKNNTEKSKCKISDYDDIVIANMRVEGVPRGLSDIFRRKKKKNALDLTPKERFKIILGAYIAYLPMFLAIIVGFTLVFLFIKFVWLK